MITLDENSIKPQVVNCCGSIVMMMTICLFVVMIMINSLLMIEIAEKINILALFGESSNQKLHVM